MTDDSAEIRLSKLGIMLLAASEPTAQYANCIEVNRLLFIDSIFEIEI